MYYGTDTRAFSLLLGVRLAFAWPSSAFGEGMRAREVERGAWVGFNIASVVSLAGLLAVVAFTNGYSPFPYYDGTALVSVLSAILIAVLVVPGTWVARLFELAPLVWVGKRSYGMYLWVPQAFHPSRKTAVHGTILLIASALTCLKVNENSAKDAIRSCCIQCVLQKV